MTTRVFIDGAAGTTGLEIRERLADRTDIALLTLDHERRRDASARSDIINAADIVILCLPDEAAREAVALVENPTTRVIDASSAHRVAPDWVYGFPEVSGRATVAGATRISNPGCYATGFIALIAPLVRAGMIPADLPLSCYAVSGYSGGGKAMIAEFEAGERAPTAWRSYALGLAHKHVPEMRDRSGLTTPPIFAPAVAAVMRGMVVDIPLHLGALGGTVRPVDLHAALADSYCGSPIVSVVPIEESAALSTVAIERCAGTDRLELFLFANEGTGQVRLVAALDNLGKGAAGAAVQNLNLLAGVDETEGLRLARS